MPVPKLSEVANINDWLDNGVAVVVTSIREEVAKKSKRKFHIIGLQDPTGPETAEWSCFSWPKFKEGDVLEITGRGVKIENSQWGLKISAGDKADIKVVGESAHHAEQQQRKETGAPAVNGKAQHVNGQTVGMAIKEAIALVGPAWNGGQVSDADLNNPLYWKAVKQAASNIIRISQSLESGHLSAPSWPTGSSQPTGTPPPAPAKPASPPPQPPPGGRADPKPRQADLDEDVPF